MQKTLVLLFLIAFTVCLKAQIPSSCNAPAPLQAYYANDVAYLALQRIYNQNSNYKDSVEIPEIYEDSIWQGLAAIFNLDSFPARDSVFDKYCIRPDYYYKYYLSVNIDTSFAWTHAWMNLQTTTGISSLDSLLSKYGFAVTSYSPYQLISVTLSTNQRLNLAPLCNMIGTYSGVISVGIGGLVSSSLISYEVTDSSELYYFGFLFDTCSSGCLGAYTFGFETFGDCSVKYLGSYGDTPLPPPVNCNITSGIEIAENTNNIKIYPDPAEDFVTATADYWSTINYKLINMYGQILRTGTFANQTIIPVNDLTKGVYLINFYTGGGNEGVNCKLIKN